MDISGKLAQANGRLESASVGVRIEQRYGRLLLRATLPPKPGSTAKGLHQQRLSLGVRANPAGLKEAEQEARRIGVLLNTGDFDWLPYLKTSNGTPLTCADWIERYRSHYLNNGGTVTTWEGDYWKVFRQLPPGALLDAATMDQLIGSIKPNTKSRVRACMALGAIAKFAGLAYNPASMRGNYSSSKVKRRELPEDELIAELYYKIKNPAWRWVYGTMATYGLRNHEVFHLNLEQFPIIEVQENTKTGLRQIFPCYPEWAEQWQLDRPILPNVNLARANDKIGHSVTEYLSPKLPFVPYDLRHAWAVRTLEFGFPIELAARQMGHSVAVHERTYHKWITAKHYQRMYEVLMLRVDRPKPPAILLR